MSRSSRRASPSSRPARKCASASIAKRERVLRTGAALPWPGAYSCRWCVPELWLGSPASARATRGRGSMLRTFLKSLILVPIGVVLILFAVANRQWTAVSLDPFSPESPALAIHLPLFLAILLALMVGVIVGG